MVNTTSNGAANSASSANGNGIAKSVSEQREPLDMSHHISRDAASRSANMLKAMYKYLMDPDIVSLGGGLPHPSTFPIHKASFELPIPPNFDGTPYTPSSAPRIQERTNMSLYKGIGPNGEYGALDLADAQQYARPAGFLPLMAQIKRLTELLHRPQYKVDQLPTYGNTDSTTKVLRTLLNPDETLLVEEFEFAPPVAAARAMGAGIRGVEIDTIGIVPEKLDALLTNWDTVTRGKKPHVLYTVPTGQNPTSASMTLARTQAVYSVAQKHDLIIMEDDPYYWQTLQKYTGPASDGESEEDASSEPGRVQLEDVKDLESFAKSLPRSYLSIDTDGRVLRLDSFSKCFAPGMRLGFLTGHPTLIERVQRITETETQEVNGLTQAFFAQLLSEPADNITNESWGLEGFARWICDIRRQYSIKRDRLVNGLTKACSKEYIQCKPVPSSGMFLWLQVNVETHPDYRTDVRETSGNSTGPRTNTNDLLKRLFEKCIDENVLVLQSSIFASYPKLPRDYSPNKEDESAAYESLEDEESRLTDKSKFLRACFAGNLEQIDTAAQRLGKAVTEFFENASRNSA